MNNAIAVREIQSRCERARQSNYFRSRQMLFAIDLFAKSLAVDMRHDVIQHTSALARVVNGNDVRVSQAAYCLDFLEKPLGPERCGNVSIENLYCNAAWPISVSIV